MSRSAQNRSFRIRGAAPVWVMAALLTAGLFSAPCAREATADPQAQVPDLSSLQSLDLSSFVWTSHGHSQIRFAGTNGYACVFGDATNPRNVGPHGQELFCNKLLESTAGGNCRYREITQSSGAVGGPFKVDETDGSYCLGQLEGAPQLAAGHKLSSGTVTCGVGADFTACIDTAGGSTHGFVIRPSGNDLF